MHLEVGSFPKIVDQNVHPQYETFILLPFCYLLFFFLNAQEDNAP